MGLLICSTEFGIAKRAAYALQYTLVFQSFLIFQQANYTVLVGFGLACAPVRCGHPSFWTHCHGKGGAARPPPIAASLLLIRSPKIDLKLSNLYSGRPCPGLFSFHWATEVKYEVPCPRPANWSFADPSGDMRKKGFIFMLAKHI